MMIYQTPTMSSTRKSSPRPQHRKLQSTASKSSTSRTRNDAEKSAERCRGRCRVQWSEKHVKEGLVLVQEAQLARVVKTGPISEHYKIDSKPFASGQWAKVYRCRSRSTGTLYAAKYSSRTRFNTDCSAELRHEIALLSLCSQSPRVVRLHDVYETPKEIILVMEYAPGGDLQTLIDGDLVPLEGDVVHFIKQLVEGLAYLHERNIAHLDIKPQNLVMMGTFPECDVKLCDFEISRVVLEGTEVREILGTPDYVAPEILHYEPITLAADMWSLGVTTYVLLTGFSPFGGETDQETFQNISLGEVDFPEELFDDISSQAKDFVAKLLVQDPSARMTAKQCLRHDWLRDAPTQAAPHLRRYLSKSREILLERVVSRENLRRAALMSQTTSQANLSEAHIHGGLSQSEMCLNYTMTGSRGSLTNSECYLSPADSQTSLNSSQASLATSQNYLLNKEQTQGLLNQAQSRSQANLNHVTRRGLLSRMRSLNQIQSQACLVASKTALQEEELSPIFGSRSQEKLYGLKCLSKSQGVLDIYRSLESIRRTKRKRKDQQNEDIPCFKPNNASIDLENLTSAQENLKIHQENIDTNVKIEQSPLDQHKFDKNESVDGKNIKSESEENLESLQSVESDTLTEDSDETSLDQTQLCVKQPCQRQHSDISSHSNNSGHSDDKEEHSESEQDEPKYTVAQLVSAFNKHQEVASQTSLEAIMTEKRVNEVTFPTGPKALRLFIPDINITEHGIVRRKTSYKPRKNWEELRKQNEKNEGVLKDFNHDSGNEDDEDIEKNHDSKNVLEKSWSCETFPDRIDDSLEHRDTRIDEKYKQCVDGVKLIKENEISDIVPSILVESPVEEAVKPKFTRPRTSYDKERLPNYIYPDVISTRVEEIDSKYSKVTQSLSKEADRVNLKDILQVDESQTSQKKNLEKLRKRTSITKVIINDNLSLDDTNNNGSSTRATSEPPALINRSESPALERSSSVSSENSSITPSSAKSEVSMSWEDVHGTCRDKEKSQTASQKKDIAKLAKNDSKKNSMTPEERRIWGKVCTGSYTRAMEKFNGRNVGLTKTNLNSSTSEKTRRKSSPNMPRSGS